MAGITGSGEGHHQGREVPFGKVYEWHAEHVAHERGCGEMMILTATSTMTACGRCGADLRGPHPVITERKGNLPDKLTHPWFCDAKEWAQQHEKSCDVRNLYRAEGPLSKNVAQGSLDFGYFIGEGVR